MQADGREDEARRARRIVLGFRVAFYAVVLIAALVVLAKRGGHADAQPLVGRTSQDAQFSMELRHGRPVAFDAQLMARCTNGARWPIRWWLRDGETTTFRIDGRRLRARGTERFADAVGEARRVFLIDAQVHDDYATGVMTFVQHSDLEHAPDFECESGQVTFTAQR